MTANLISANYGAAKRGRGGGGVAGAKKSVKIN